MSGNRLDMMEVVNAANDVVLHQSVVLRKDGVVLLPLQDLDEIEQVLAVEVEGPPDFLKIVNYLHSINRLYRALADGSDYTSSSTPRAALCQCYSRCRNKAHQRVARRRGPERQIARYSGLAPIPSSFR